MATGDLPMQGLEMGVNAVTQASVPVCTGVIYLIIIIVIGWVLLEQYKKHR